MNKLLTISSVIFSKINRWVISKKFVEVFPKFGKVDSPKKILVFLKIIGIFRKSLLEKVP